MKTLSRIPAIAVFSMILVAISPVSGYCQQADVYPGPKQQLKPASSPKLVGPREPKAWSLDDALPDKSPAARARTPDVKSDGNSSLGRIPLRSGAGSIGFETETKVKSTEFPDGRKTPGVETATQHPPSYLGLSISVPTPDKSILPFPIPPFGKSE